MIKFFNTKIELQKHSDSVLSIIPPTHIFSLCRCHDCMARVLLVDGLRTPFQLPCTGYSNLTGADLLANAFRRLLSRLSLDKGDIGHVIAGNVLHEPSSPNVAAVSAARTGIIAPAHSVSMACISGQAALSQGVNMIHTGQAEIVLVGGVEFISDFPIRVSENARKILLKIRNTEDRMEKVKLASKIRPRDLTPDILRVVEFQTQETFVANGDKMAARFGVSRDAQDEFGYRSHALSRTAAKQGLFSNMMCSVHNPHSNTTIDSDSTLRDWKREKMGKLRPVRRAGTVTVATANQPCDGAAACLLASEGAAQRLNLNPRAQISRTAFAACSPFTELLMGSTHALARLKSEQGYDPGRAGVVELYEGFAGEVLSQLSALRSSEYARTALSLDNPVADIEPGLVNRWGGSIGLGHPFGATGLRLLLHTVGRMEAEKARLGIVAGCAGGGLGAAFAVTPV